MPKLLGATGSRGPFGLCPQPFGVVECITLQWKFLLQGSGVMVMGWEGQ